MLLSSLCYYTIIVSYKWDEDEHNQRDQIIICKHTDEAIPHLIGSACFETWGVSKQAFVVRNARWGCDRSQ